MSKKEKYAMFRNVALTETDAKDQGYEKLTLPYKESEVQMLEKVVRDMQGVPYAVVSTKYGFEVWRKGMLSEKEAEKQSRAYG